MTEWTAGRLLRLAFARGAMLALACLLVFGLLLAVISSFDGFLSTGPVAVSRWDLAFVLLLGVAAAPLTLIEEWGRPDGEEPCSLPRALGVAAAVTLLASLALLAAYLQVTYAFTLGQRGPEAALDALGGSVANMVGMWSETRTLLAAYAPPFGLAALGRLRRWRLGVQILVASLGTLLTYYASMQGFDAVPIVRWLAGSAWAQPVVGALVYSLPVPLGALLPLTGRWLETRRAASNLR